MTVLNRCASFSILFPGFGVLDLEQECEFSAKEPGNEKLLKENWQYEANYE